MLLYIALAILIARLFAWMLLQRIIRDLEAIVQEGETIIATYGRTVGQLQAAGKNDRLDQINHTGGWLYRAGVPLAAFLMWWPIGPLLMGQMIRQTYADAGKWLGPEQMGSYFISYDLRRGFAWNIDYYHTALLKGCMGVLRLAKLLY